MAINASMYRKKPLLALALLAVATSAHAQWRETGGWQCGPFVRVTTSIDGRDGIDFFVTGAWFNNHYTLRQGQLYYNGTLCTPFGYPFGPPRRVTKRQECQVDDGAPRKPGIPTCE